MSTTRTPAIDDAVTACRPTNVTPVTVDAATLESTAPSYLRELKAELAAEGYQPAALAVRATFDEDCSLATQTEADRLRAHLRAASFLGVGRLDVAVDAAADPDKVRPALDALAERAEREGIRLDIGGDAASSVRPTRA